MTPRATFRAGLSVALMLFMDGCGQPAGPNAPATGQAVIAAAATQFGDIDAAQTQTATVVVNPLAGQPAAVARGATLFVQMNCAGCHGYDLGGAMGPNLTDRYWRYGGTSAAIYRSIAEGRPQGMPAWRKALPPADIWSLVSYIEVFGGTTAPSDDQAGRQGDVAALPTAATGSAASYAPATAATGKLAHP